MLLCFRGPFVVALGKTWCPDHFVCQNPRCGQKLLDIGFVEEGGFLYCEKDYEQYFAPTCTKCGKPIVGVGQASVWKCVSKHDYRFDGFKDHSCMIIVWLGLEISKKYWNEIVCSKKPFNDSYFLWSLQECVNALQKTYHPVCFICYQCKQPIGGNQFHLEDGNPYCENGKLVQY